MNFKIKKGETICILESGSGNCTLVNLIARVYEIDNEKLVLIEFYVKDYYLKRVNQQFSYVSQKPSLFYGSIIENLTKGVQSFKKEYVISIILMSNANFVFYKKMFPNGLNLEVSEGGV